MNKTTGFWYNLFDMPAVYNSVRTILLFGKGKMFQELKNATNVQKGETVLDVGSGPGELSQLFSEEYAGVDYSQNYVAYAQKKYPTKKFFQGNVLDLTLQENSYDIILLASFIHHFSDQEVEKILGNMKKVARKKIRFISWVSCSSRARPTPSTCVVREGPNEHSGDRAIVEKLRSFQRGDALGRSHTRSDRWALDRANQ